MTSSNKTSSQFLYVEESEFRHEVIYFIIVDRFFDGSHSSDNIGKEGLYDPTRTKWGEYWGGDLSGICQKIDYLKELGVTAVWVSPLFEQVDDKMHDSAPMHGYWTKDFKRLNPHFIPAGDSNRIQDSQALKDFVDTFNQHNIKIILDVVCNHSSPEINGKKGIVYDDGVPVADFNNDHNKFYYHNPSITDWDDEFQLIHGEMAGLATFNEKNVAFRRYIISAIKNWLDQGIHALRVDTLKHMPIWFWQEFVSEIRKHRPSTFLFGEYGFGKPWDQRSVDYANHTGMSILDFGLCDGIRFAFSGKEPGGFLNIQRVIDEDHVYHRANELITFFDNHDMPRFLSITDSRQNLELAVVLLMTLRGIPCLFYGTEQYLVNNTNGGEDPYNRPMMDTWDKTTPLFKIIQNTSALRSANPALNFGAFEQKYLTESIYGYTRSYRDSRVFTLVNQGEETTIDIANVNLADGDYTCVLSGRTITVSGGGIWQHRLGLKEANLLHICGAVTSGQTVLDIQINGYETKPGETIVLTGDHPELGGWDLSKALPLEYVNRNTWFGDFGFNEASGLPVMFKLAVLRCPQELLADPEAVPADQAPIVENLVHRHIQLPSQGRMKLDLIWGRT